MADQETKEVPIQDKYRALFSTGLGMEVLDDILRICHFGEILNTENSAMVARYNVGLVILTKCLGSGNRDAVRDFISSMLGLGRIPQ